MVSKTANENENENEYGSDGNTSLYSNIIDTSNAIDDDDSITIIMCKDRSSLENKNSNNNEIRKHNSITAAAAAAAVIATITMLMMVVYYPGGNNDHNSNNNNIRGLADGPERNIYDPNVDYCFKLKNVDKYCWYPTCSCPYGDWEETTFSPNDSGCGSQCHWYPSYSCPYSQCTDVDSSNGGTTPEPTETPPPPQFPQNDDGNGNDLIKIGKVDAATESGSGGSYIGISALSSSLTMMMTTNAIVIVGYNTM